jgi:hypothetical protein
MKFDDSDNDNLTLQCIESCTITFMNVEREKCAQKPLYHMEKIHNSNKNKLIISISFLISFSIIMILIGNLTTQSVYAHANPISLYPSPTRLSQKLRTFLKR